MTSVSRETILGAPIPTTGVEIPEWGGTLRVRGLTLGAREELAQWAADQKAAGKGLGGLRVRIFLACAVDASGKPLFRSDEISIVEALPDALVERAVQAAERLNGLGEAAVTAAEKNSGAGPSGSSSSASPAISG